MTNQYFKYKNDMLVKVLNILNDISDRTPLFFKILELSYKVFMYRRCRNLIT